MPRRPTWKKDEAEKTARAIAATVAEAFAVPLPEVNNVKDIHPEWETWEFGFDTLEVWTDYGPAEMNVRISPTFAHLYFRFNDVARAWANISYHCDRLNRHSGKWNWHAAPPETLLGFARDLTGDFARIAEPLPDPDELAAWKVKKAEEAARWAAMFAEMRSEQGLAP